MSLEINKQKMKYSLSLGLQPQYRRDDDGNIIYTGYTDDDGTFIPYLDEDGNKIPEVTGEPIEAYTEPVIFYSSISNKLSEATARNLVLMIQPTMRNLLQTKTHFRLWKVH